MQHMLMLQNSLYFLTQVKHNTITSKLSYKTEVMRNRLVMFHYNIHIGFEK